jgi:hypothetical protein
VVLWELSKQGFGEVGVADFGFPRRLGNWVTGDLGFCGFPSQVWEGADQ